MIIRSLPLLFSFKTDDLVIDVAIHNLFLMIEIDAKTHCSIKKFDALSKDHNNILFIENLINENEDYFKNQIGIICV